MTTWQPGATPTQDPATGGWGFIAEPQPGTFTPGEPLSNPVAFNQDPTVLGKGQPVSVTGAKGSTGNPATDLTRTVSGTVAGTNCTIRNPG
jgi:hypothetical protein